MRREALLAKRKELEEIVRNQEYLQILIAAQRNNDYNFKHGLGSEYLQIVDKEKQASQ